MTGPGDRPPAIRVRKLTKAFGHHAALRGVDLEVAEGEFLTLFGPNGAGKTTLIRIVASLARPSSGTVHVCGQDLGKEATAVRRQIGPDLPQSAAVWRPDCRREPALLCPHVRPA